MQPYQPGKPAEELQRELGLTDIVKLASNENPLGPSPLAVEAVKAAAERIHIYPDGAAYELRVTLAGRYCLPTDHFVFGNGSDELILYLGLAYLEPGDEVVIARPSFVRYDAAAALNNATLTTVPLTCDLRHDLPAMRAAITPRTKLVFIANPNNPTGTIVYENEWRAFLADLPGTTIVVIDEAYFEYVDHPNYPDTMVAPRHENVVVLRTFSKAYGLAGLRVGYGIAAPVLLDPIERVREPFNVNTLAQVAASAALSDVEHIRRTREMNSNGKRFLYCAFARLGIEFVPTEANFVLFNAECDGPALCERLLQHGVIVRPCAGFGLPRHVRVSIGIEAQNKRFVSALEACLGSVDPKQH